MKQISRKFNEMCNGKGTNHIRKGKKVKKAMFVNKDTGEWICPVCASSDWFSKFYAYDNRNKQPIKLKTCKVCLYKAEYSNTTISFKINQPTMDL